MLVLLAVKARYSGLFFCFVELPEFPLVISPGKLSSGATSLISGIRINRREPNQSKP
jgi:hypothetical protein